MKKRLPLLMLMLFFLLFAGCQKQEEAMQPPVEESEEPLKIETLRVEISRNGLNTQSLMSAVKELPGLLEKYFAETDVEIGSIKVTVGASPADTAKALAEGRIDLGFLSAEGYLSYNGEANVLLADEGIAARIYAAPTEYGKQLSTRADSGNALSWTEMVNARWGVLETGNICGCFGLWLAEKYEGSGMADLPNVTVYDSDEAIARAVAGEKIDALVCPDDFREEMTLLGQTKTMYSQLAVSAPELTDERFAAALEMVLTWMEEEEPERMLLFGAAHFTALADEDLDPMRRLLATQH